MRSDTITYQGRLFTPTTDSTVWINTWAEFTACGGTMMFNECQTEITLYLPTDHKFSIRFQREA